MQIIIEIPDDKLTQNQSVLDISLDIINGTVVSADGYGFDVLPKGHGVLKDADVMVNKLCTHEASEFFGSVTCAEILDFINDEKPIIEADRSEIEE